MSSDYWANEWTCDCDYARWYMSVTWLASCSQVPAAAAAGDDSKPSAMLLREHHNVAKDAPAGGGVPPGLSYSYTCNKPKIFDTD